MANTTVKEEEEVREIKGRDVRLMRDLGRVRQLDLCDALEWNVQTLQDLERERWSPDLETSKKILNAIKTLLKPVQNKVV